MTATFTLLVVDDEKQNRTLLTELLRPDYQVILAKNGVQALSRAQEHLPDLILLDVMMPEMDGYEVIHALKENDLTRDIPVIFITALDSAEDEEKGLELGAVDYISKPFRPSIVRARIRNHLQSVHQRRLLEQLALLDGLTEIPNRRRFSQVLEFEWRRCMRNALPLSLIVVDVDHFKIYNDSHGHAAGDIVLREIAGTLRNGLKRASDFVARYGGEEFVILLPEIDAEGGMLLAEQVRRSVEALSIPHDESFISPWVTISMGGATCIPDSPEPGPDLFIQADEQLYAAKNQGRNRVAWAASPGLSQNNPPPVPASDELGEP
ncbi:MAG: diguanylate cyclase [Pseudomonadota bacterium]